MRLLSRTILATAAILLVGVLESDANAQYGAPSIRQNYRDIVTRGPTVSPYLSLFNRSGSSTTPYYSFVKPRLEQEAENRRAQQQTAQLRQELNQVSARANAAQQAGRLPTGHTTVFMNYSHYFRMPGR
ncbi:MAG: hypothetical protein WD875_06595 [Pirellulales bacterium]